MTDADTEDDSTDTLEERVTSPMQTFGTREVTLGIVIVAVGLLLTFVLPLLF